MQTPTSVFKATTTRLSISKTHEVVSQTLQKSLRRVKEVWNNADGTTIFDLKRSPCRAYPFELYFNLFLIEHDVCVGLGGLC